jgi:hypothetical protein
MLDERELRRNFIHEFIELGKKKLIKENIYIQILKIYFNMK